MNKRVICLMGPTATGKTEVAMRLSDQLPIQIISVDSAMIYRGMDIGTAKPDAQTLDQYPHQLVDICDPTERYSTADFRRDALVAIEESFNAGKIPLLVGGTFLYFQSLLEGISPIPSVSQSILDDLAEKLELEGSPALHQILSEVDPESGVRLNPNDSQRVVRALSVYYETGKPLTYFWSLPKQAGLPYPFIKLALANHDEKKRNQQIALRYQAMIERGLVAEVERLRQMYPELDLDYPSMRAVGYRQIWNYLEGETSLEDAVKLAIIATRQYAKRQRTWLRREVDLLTYDVGKPNFLSDLSQNVMQFLR
ncbi:tRNA (adenosine(37)-N6)-dimethylallyltransferase MiaA [Ignatzschineria larvae DSM 13226]|uniref:tRNA dimethylallyltransferase n=1 Tax=Ignatzschineria larvae DSM 13226 TaxID=1111732 RepID=A0ABZ3BYX2_9GAMM|nr:tRNA (adenosine(37)-N6)-dimethylallyltransferase MiaA [Ignatzschineria larvae]